MAGLSFSRFTLVWAALLTVISLIPAIYGFAALGSSAYLGFQYNLDDHLVYYAWADQVAQGRLLFENRFAVDPQPGLTFNLYFLVAGVLGLVLGVPLALLALKALMTFFAVLTLGRLIEALPGNPEAKALGLVLSTAGAGLGFLAWRVFGVELQPGDVPLLGLLASSRTPADVWQPEVFFFPSVLTNGLFAAALTLMFITFRCVLDCRESWRPVLPGAIAFGVLMNIHSYDALLVVLVLVGLLCVLAGGKEIEPQWILRTVVICLGAVPAAVWFLAVLAQDSVFQSRAATETFSPMVGVYLWGLFPLVALTLVWSFTPSKESAFSRFPLILTWVIGLLLMTLTGSATGYPLPAFAAIIWLSALLVALYYSRIRHASVSLIVSWAAVGLASVYFPALFQRKLAMALAVPWGILAGLGLKDLLVRLDVPVRKYAMMAALVLVSLSSVLWLLREIALIDANVSNTTLHSVAIPNSVRLALETLRDQEGPKVAIAPPGISLINPETNMFQALALPDFNPHLAAIGRAYAYAGHWSETPNYAERRRMAQEIFSPRTSDQIRESILNSIAERGDIYLLLPKSGPWEQVDGIQFADLRPLGDTLFEDEEFALVRYTPKAPNQ
jgi:arabinosyltransferase C